MEEKTGRPGQKRVQFWIDEKIVAKWEAAIESSGYKSRHEWFREQVRNTVKGKKPGKEEN